MSIPAVIPIPLVASEVTDKLYLGSSEYVKNAMVFCLREAFSHPYTPEEYRYDKDEKKRQISIYRAFPKRTVKFPVIIVETKIGDGSITSLGNEEGHDEFNEAGEMAGRTYWGTISMPTVLTVITDTPVDRERLGDLLFIYVRSIFKDTFNRERMPFLSILPGAAGEELIGNKNRFLYTIDLAIQTEFNYFIDWSLLELFSKINLQEMLFHVDGSDETPQPDQEEA